MQQYSQDLVYSQNNQWRSSQERRDSNGAVGGDFWCYKRNYSENSSLGEGQHYFSQYVAGRYEGGRPYYEVPQFAAFDQISNANFPTPVPDVVHLNALASEAISKIAPNKPEAALSSFVGELREGIPHATLFGSTGRERTRRARNAGDEYLNVEFGWKPLVRDVQKFAHSVINAERIIADYEKGSGKLIRRGYRWPTEVEVQDEEIIASQWSPQPTMDPRLYGLTSKGDLKRTVTVYTERWFRAAFLYAVPPRGTPQGYASRANKLLGTNLSPEMLWNLAPWSWAADWAGNMGTLASNLTLFNTDCLVMPWSYIMEHTTVKVRYSLDLPGGDVYKTHPGPHFFTQEFTTELKYRKAGTPYGFEIDWPEFSAKQLAILGALGISRS